MNKAIRILGYILILASIISIVLGFVELLDNVSDYNVGSSDWYNKRALKYIYINSLIILGCALNILFILYVFRLKGNTNTISSAIKKTKKEIELLKLQKELGQLKSK